jgi:phosphate transport system substrate-binding protein
MKTGRKTWLGAVICLVFLASSQVATCGESQMVRVSGALPLSDLVNGWAEDFMKSKPNSRVTVFGKSAGHGYSQFLDGQANLVMATRKMTKDEQTRAAEKGIRVHDVFVMNVPVAIVTNAKNPVDSLTLDQLKGVYAGSISNWKDVGGPNEPIKVLMRPYPATGVTVLLKEVVLKDQNFRSDAVVMSTFKNMVHVCEQAMAIGHMPNTGKFCDPSKFAIKILGLKQDAGSPAFLPGQADYALNMPFHFVWNADPVIPEVDDFVKYVLNKVKDGQRP